MNRFQRFLIVQWLGLKQYGFYDLEYRIDKLEATFYGKGGRNLVDAHIYKHLENGTLFYCSEKQTTHTNFQYLGTAKVPEKDVVTCSFS